MGSLVSPRSCAWSWRIVYAFVALLVAHLFATCFGMNAYPPGAMTPMLDGTAERPFVLRALVPVVVRQIDAATPRSVATAVERLAPPFIPPEMGGYRQILLFVLFWLCFAGLAEAMSQIVVRLYDVSIPAAKSIGLLSLVSLPAFFRYFDYLYDPATVLLTATTMLAVLAGSWWGFLISFTLACANKETAILYLPVACLCWPGIAWDRRLLSGAALATCWFLIRGWVLYTYRLSNGDVVIPALVEHNLVVWRVAPVSFAVFMLLIAFVAYRARADRASTPRIVRLGLLWTLLPLLGTCLFFGFIDEMRDYLEAFPYLFLTVMPWCAKRLGAAVAARPEAL